MSGSYTKPTDSSVSEALSGLNPQVQSAPFSLEMVSVLLVAALPVLLLPGLELVLEPAVQPAASIPAATMTPYLVRRLMPFVLTAVWTLIPDQARSRRLPYARFRRLAGACARDSLRACLTSVFGGGYPFREFC